MPEAATVTCPFSTQAHAIGAPDPHRAELREAGAVVQAEAPAGGPFWIVTDADLAREVLADTRFAKDTALAPPHWDRRVAGLEPTAAEQLSVTTLDGEAHGRLRRAFAPLFSATRMRAAYPRLLAIAERLLARLEPGEVDLVQDFTTRYPLAVLCDLLAIPDEHVDTAMAACRLMHTDYPEHVGQAMSAFADLATAALAGDGPATELAGRMPPGSTRRDLHYQVFTLLFAGQLTTDLTIGFLVARLLGDPAAPTGDDELVRDTLRRHPPAPFTLWRFTSTELDLAGVRLPANSPVLIDIKGVNERVGPDDNDLTFGAGPHYCIGAQLARLELRALAETFRTHYPEARLTTPFDDLRHSGPGGIMGSRLHALPVVLR
ncbi:cytochrome P450 [Saccharothrix sp. NRRL B-16348]|uniref:cytochrome P450 n=1 Tax=Saccharothrix sp. NRRL B-16348 TaxID=1415542 RepID=UPI0006ADB04E|nr:cytochrome P450 [Saccharothrix sp. NRRL B-16348]KOX23506.1 cytochrome P450 [Saccharothrix sp. NRRL B-16348]